MEDPNKKDSDRMQDKFLKNMYDDLFSLLSETQKSIDAQRLEIQDIPRIEVPKQDNAVLDKQINDALKEERPEEPKVMAIEAGPKLEELFKKIDNCNLTEESKLVFKKMIEYAKKYNAGQVKNYIPFNMRIYCDNDSTLYEITNILLDGFEYFKYLKNKEAAERSFYVIEDSSHIVDMYTGETSLVLFKDVDGLLNKDKQTKDKLLKIWENEIFKHSNQSGITTIIVNKNKDKINELFKNYIEEDENEDFYGTMDGASKFVKGDATAGLIITFINLIGGTIMGVSDGLEIMDAIQKFVILTIGDGLVSQVPSMLISLSTGILVTKGSKDSDFSESVLKQLFGLPRVLYMVGLVMIFFGVFTPLGLIFIALGIVFIIGARKLEQNIGEQAIENEVAAPEQEAEEIRRPENVVSLLQVDPIELEFGYGIIPLADVNQGGDLLDRVVMIRRQIALELGTVVPIIRLRDNIQLNPNQYIIKIKGIHSFNKTDCAYGN